MQIPALFVTAFIVGLSGAMMPGPLLTLTITESARRGFIAGPLIVLGHAILELILVLALLAGAAVYLSQPGVTRIISILGGGFLIYLGIITVRDILAGRVQLNNLEQPSSGTSRFHPVLGGALISLSNPYWSLWWATIGLSYLTLALQKGFPGVTSFYAGHIMADLVWYSLIAAAIAGGRKFINQKIYSAILVFCGVFLVALGIYFLYGGFLS